MEKVIGNMEDICQVSVYISKLENRTGTKPIEWKS